LESMGSAIKVVDGIFMFFLCVTFGVSHRGV
jgi:hypothetical protein